MQIQYKMRTKSVFEIYKNTEKRVFLESSSP